jgi:hypothetical protein
MRKTQRLRPGIRSRVESEERARKAVFGIDIGNLSTAFIGGHLWGEENGFSTTILQPMLFYNLPNAWNIHYNNIISYDWNASAGNGWTFPLGLGVGKMFALKGGHGIEPVVGVYYNAVRPDGAANWALKWAISWLLP